MITEKYEVYVSFAYHDCDDTAAVDNMLLKLVDDGHDGNVFTGNPACYPYVTVTYPMRAEAEAAEKRIRDFLTKRKCRVDP